MAQGKQQPKVERNPYIRFRDDCTKDRQLMNFDFMSSADVVKQSEKISDESIRHHIMKSPITFWEIVPVQDQQTFASCISLSE